MTRLADLVETSRRVGATRSRLAKVRELAELLRALDPAEIRIGVQYLSGEPAQGRVGIGPAVLIQARDATPASAGSLSLAEVDRTITDVAALRGPGVNSLRSAALSDLFVRATRAEQEFLFRLLLGEIRQGALGGVMVDAIAAAAELPVADLRRAPAETRLRFASGDRSLMDLERSLIPKSFSAPGLRSELLERSISRATCLPWPRWRYRRG